MTEARRTNFVAYAPSNCLEEHHEAIQGAEQEREEARHRDLQAQVARQTGLTLREVLDEQEGRAGLGSG